LIFQKKNELEISQYFIYTKVKMNHVFKLLDFNVYNNKCINYDSDDEEFTFTKNDTSKFGIQMFGINEQGHTASIQVEDYQPFFYLKVHNNWGQTKKNEFYNHLKEKVGKYYENSIIECKLIDRKKLYGFDAGKKHRFIEIKFSNINIIIKLKIYGIKILLMMTE